MAKIANSRNSAVTGRVCSEWSDEVNDEEKLQPGQNDSFVQTLRSPNPKQLVDGRP